ncbi:MAG: ABC transporter ATP-binding protein [Rhodobacterales bacterium]|nr:ABC transporter ATP-binding protein [Rhodobacterales bacterium]
MIGTEAGSARMAARLWRTYLRPHAGRLVLGGVVLTAEGATLGALSAMIEPLFDRVLNGRDPAAIGLIAWSILGLFVLRAVAGVTGKAVLTAVAQRVTAALQTDMVRHLLALDLRFYQTNPPGALIERVQGDTLVIQNVWTNLLTGIARDLISLIALLTVAISIDLTWTLAALVGAPLLVLPAVRLQRYIRRKTAQMRQTAGQRATRLDEIFHLILPIRLNGMESYQIDRFGRLLDRIRRVEVRMATGRAMIPGLIDVITGIGFCVVLVLGAQEVREGERTTGEFMAFFSAMALTFQPIRRLGDLSGLWQSAAASLERIFTLLDTRPGIVRPAGADARPAPGAPEIVFDDVHFAWGTAPVLQGLSFTAPAGRTTALVGPSGAGKSTVFALLTGIADPERGRIRLGGAAVTDMPLDRLRAQFSAVTQDAALFDETLRDNLTLGQDGVTQAQLWAALQAAQLADFVAGLPEGLDTPAGPRGSALSGGQRQRVAIARAILRDAPVLLLDEATSALDAQSEAAVTEALARLSQGRTTLVIAHRLATVRHADHIVVIDEGRAVDQGTHDELSARPGLYADLCRLQFTA